MSGSKMRSRAPRANAETRAEGIRNDASSNTLPPEPEANFAAIYVVRHFGLALPLARTIAALASLGRAFG
jgi:hypothetical protein